MIWGGIALLFGAGVCVAAVSFMVSEKRQKSDHAEISRLKEINEQIRIRLETINMNLFDMFDHMKQSDYVFNSEYMAVPAEEKPTAIEAELKRVLPAPSRLSSANGGNKRPRTPEERAEASERMFRRWAEKRARDAKEGQPHPAPERITTSQDAHGAS